MEEQNLTLAEQPQDEKTVSATSETTEAATVEGGEAAKPAVKETSRIDNIKAVLEHLYQDFPKAFIKGEGEILPLKTGIFEDLRVATAGNPAYSTSKIRAALRLYTSRLKYLYALKNHTKRIDLLGNEVEDVSADHIEHANESIKAINDKLRANKKDKKGEKSAEGKGEVKPRPQAQRNRKPNKMPAKKPAAIHGTKASAEALTLGTEVLVLSSANHFVHGTVAQKAEKDNVMVTLKTGMTVLISLDRVLLPAEPKKTQKD